MSTTKPTPSTTATHPALPHLAPSAATRALAMLGRPALQTLGYIGAATALLVEAAGWIWRAAVLRRVRVGRAALYAQIVRLGVKAVAVVVLVNACIGLILALQMAPPLDEFGQIETVANIIAVAVFRELGPLISAIVMTGIAGASIAAELGTMVVGEEIEALEVHALNPVRFLVMPRLIATLVCLMVLCVLAELVAVASGWWIGVYVLDIPSVIYIDNTIDQLKISDFYTGLFKAGVFGVIISLIACYNGLSVTGGAAGVGRATTNTVVHSIVVVIFTDLMFTAFFYQLGWT
jgi:phospholipid/cholesterol/gamma-HCH transport system permease protein